MAEATLTVTLQKFNKLEFILRSPRGCHIAEARYAVELRSKLDDALKEFRECKKGSSRDESRFVAIGQLYFQLVIPSEMRDPIRRLSGSLEVLTNDLTLPWEIFHDGRHFLGQKLNIVRQILVKGDGSRPVAAAAPVPRKFALIIADPAGDLRGARAEGVRVLKSMSTLGECDALIGPRRATWENIMSCLISTQYELIHIAAEVIYDAVSGTSAIRLKDGYLWPDKVRKAFHGSPLVVLAACGHFDRDPSASGGGVEPVGVKDFVQAFILGAELGSAAAVVCAMWRIPDTTQVTEFILHFYELVFRGVDLGEALRSSRIMAQSKRWGPRVYSSFVLYGDASLVLFPGSMRRSRYSKVQHAEPADLRMSTHAESEPPSYSGARHGELADPRSSAGALPNPSAGGLWEQGLAPKQGYSPAHSARLPETPGVVREAETRDRMSWVGRAGWGALQLVFGASGSGAGTTGAGGTGGESVSQIAIGHRPGDPVILPANGGGRVTQEQAGGKRDLSYHTLRPGGLLRLAIVAGMGFYALYQTVDATKERLRAALTAASDSAERISALEKLPTQTMKAQQEEIRGLKTSIEEMRQASRARLRVSKVVLLPSEAAGEKRIAVLTIVNRGMSSALHVTVTGTLAGGTDTPKPVSPLDVVGDASRTFRPDDVIYVSLSAGEPLSATEQPEASTLFARGVITYKDVFQKEQHTPFCFKTSEELIRGGLIMSPCKRGNSANNHYRDE